MSPSSPCSPCHVCEVTFPSGVSATEIAYHYFAEHLFPRVSSHVALACVYCKATSSDPSTILGRGRGHDALCPASKRKCPHCSITFAVGADIADHIRKKHLCLCGTFSEADAPDMYLKRHVSSVEDGHMDGLRREWEEPTLLSAEVGKEPPVDDTRIEYNGGEESLDVGNDDSRKGCEETSQVKKEPVEKVLLDVDAREAQKTPFNELFDAANNQEHLIPTEADDSEGNTIERKKREHTRKKSVKSFACDQCDYVSHVSKWVIRKHVQIVHLQLKPYACHLCERKFSQKAKMKSHVEGMNELRSNYVCAECDYRTSWKCAFGAHLKNAHRY